MKRVLILNGDSFVGVQVARCFSQSREYQVDVTLCHQPQKKRAALEAAGNLAAEASHNRTQNAAAATIAVPAVLTPYVTSVVPNHNDNPDVFGQCLLDNDVIIAVLEDDAYEAECAIKILMGTHYNVEKTFVLVSSVMTWANTLDAERAKVRAERRRAWEAERAAFLAEMEEEGEEDEEMPEELREFKDDKEPLPPEELVAPRVFSESAYTERVPLPRYQHWKELEHVVKHANSETLHTYVLFAGVAYGYGDGGGALGSLMHAAWNHQTLPLYGPGENVIPMIHVQDLSTIIYKVGSAYDVLDERYLFAVDRGNHTQRQILNAMASRLGGVVHPVVPLPCEANGGLDMVHLRTTALPPPPTMEELQASFLDTIPNGQDAFLTDIRAEPEAVLNLLDEADWIALDGFVENVDKVVFEFQRRRGLPPARAVITGPPLSGHSAVAETLAKRLRVPLLTLTSVTSQFEQHVADLREELRAILLRRLRRRRARARDRRRRAAAAEKQRLRDERKARRAAKENSGDDEDGNPAGNGGEDGDEEDGEDEEQGDDEDEENDSQMSGDDRHKDDASVSLSTEMEEAEAEARVTERYLLGPSAAEEEDLDDEDGLDEEMEENGEDGDGEEDVMDEDGFFPDEAEEANPEEGIAAVSRAQRRARAAVRSAETQEMIRVTQLRQEYRLSLKALAMKRVNGALPRPPAPVEEDEEEEDDDRYGTAALPSNAARGGRGRSNAADGDGEGDEESDGEGEGEEDGERGPSAEEDNEDAQTTSSSADDSSAKGKTPVEGEAGGGGGADAAAGHVQYLDEALAFFVRWRLRQPDCRNQGYVLESFPQTVRQACLTFMAPEGGEEGMEAAAEESRQRVLPPTSVDAVPPPEDAAFPLADLTELEEAQRRQMEADLRADRLRAEDLTILQSSETGVLTPVLERFFPNVVVVLEEADAVLQCTATAYANAQAAAQTVQRLIAVNPASGSRPASAQTPSHGGFPPSRPLSAAAHSPSAAEWASAITGGGSRLALPPAAPSSFDALVAQQQRRAQLCEVVDHFYEALQRYKNHHAPAGPPATSLVTWYQTVTTTEVVGAVPEPTLPRGGDGDGENAFLIDSEADEGEEGGGEGTAAVERPPTARSARVLLVRSPARDAVELALEAERAFRPLDVPSAQRPASRPGDNDGVSFATVASSSPPTVTVSAVQARVLDPLSAFAQAISDTLYRSLKPSAIGRDAAMPIASDGALAGQPATAGMTTFSSSAPIPVVAASAKSTSAGTDLTVLDPVELEEEHAALQFLRALEEEHKASQAANAAAAIAKERRTLRQFQMSEELLGVAEQARLPLEKYLMTYAIPSVTPLLAEVVRTRPEDPATALADLLFAYQRRTTLRA